MASAQEIFICMLGKIPQNVTGISTDYDKQNTFLFERRESELLREKLFFESVGPTPYCVEWRDTLNALVLNGFLNTSSRDSYGFNSELFTYALAQRLKKFTEQERTDIDSLSREFYSRFGLN